MIANTISWFRSFKWFSHSQGHRERGGQLGHFALGPTLLMGLKRSIYFNRTVKHSIKAVTTYILPRVPQALSAALIIAVNATYSSAVSQMQQKRSHERAKVISILSDRPIGLNSYRIRPICCIILLFCTSKLLR